MSATKTVTVRNLSRRNYNGVKHGCDATIPEFELGPYLAAGFELVSASIAPEPTAPTVPQTAPAQESAPVNYSRLTRSQLTAELEARGIEFPGEAVNKDLAALLKASDEAPAEPTEPEGGESEESGEPGSEGSDEAPAA